MAKVVLYKENKMRNFIPLIAVTLATSISTVFGDSTSPAAPELQDTKKVSKAFGHIVGQNLLALGLDFDMKEVLQGIQDCVNGLEAPMSETECIQAISLIQETAYQKQSQENLKKAEEFLTTNKAAPGVVEIDSGKIQYVVLQTGNGKEVETTSSPVIRYTGKFIDGKIFGESTDDEVLSLDDTTVGLKKGILGMKEGEKRRIFIHPEYGEGMNSLLPPGSLLTFDIEVVKANAPKADEPLLSISADESAGKNL
jgi:peptidylprolyl isomerase